MVNQPELADGTGVKSSLASLLSHEYFQRLNEKYGDTGDIWIDYSHLWSLDKGPALIQALAHEYLPKLKVRLTKCTLKLLHATRRQHDDAFWNGLQDLGKSLGEIESLQTLFLFHSNDDVESFLLASAPILSQVRQITDLDLSFHYVTVPSPSVDKKSSPGMLEFAKALEGHPNLQSLSLFSLAETDQNLEHAILSLPHLRQIKLFGDQAQVLPLSPECVQGLTTKVCDLNCYQCRVSAHQVSALFQGLGTQHSSRVEHLALGSCVFPRTAETTQALIQAIAGNTSLQSLRLGREDGMDSSLLLAFAAEQRFGARLGAALGRHPRLQALDLVMPEGPSESERAEWALVLRGMSASSTLEKLSLGYFVWTGNNNTAMRHSLTQVLTRAPLRSLKLKGLTTDEEWNVVFPCIAQSPSLVSLLIDGSAFNYGRKLLTHTILSSLAETLGQQPNDLLQRLEDVSLRHTYQSAECPHAAASLANLITQAAAASRLASIKISSSSALKGGDEVAQLLAAAQASYGVTEVSRHQGDSLLDCKQSQAFLTGLLAMNAAGRRYLLEEESSVGQPQVLACRVLTSVSNNVDCLFVHLRENPSLLLSVE